MTNHHLEDSVKDTVRLWHVMVPELVVAGALLGATFLFGSTRSVQTLQSRFDRVADTNRDGNISPAEMIGVYDTLGLSHTTEMGRVYVPRLSISQMEEYISRSASKERTTYK